LKLKIDENLPAECAVHLRNAGFEADTVVDEFLAGAEARQEHNSEADATDNPCVDEPHAS